MGAMKIHQTDENVLILPGAQVVGDVTFGPDCSVWYNAVLRADRNPIRVGTATNIQDGVIIHAESCPVVLGDHVTVGHGAIVHSCTVGDDSLVGMGSIILDGAVIGKNCLVAAGALVTKHTVVPDGSLVMGSPAKVRRPLTPEEIQSIHDNSLHHVALKEQHR